MLRIEWWHHAAYGNIAKLAAADFAWEYLRRNDGYRHDCQTLALTQWHDAQKLEAFTRRWGVLFPKRSRDGGESVRSSVYEWSGPCFTERKHA